MKIMVIDDVSMNILRLKQAAKSFGAVEGYQDARAGLEALQFAYLTSAPYDVLFLDIVMPEMSGFDVLAAVVKMGADLPPAARTKVVMVTARSQEESVRQAIRGGASAYVIKPYSDEKIHELIRRLTGAEAGTSERSEDAHGGGASLDRAAPEGEGEKAA